MCASHTLVCKVGCEYLRGCVCKHIGGCLYVCCSCTPFRLYWTCDKTGSLSPKDLPGARPLPDWSTLLSALASCTTLRGDWAWARQATSCLGLQDALRPCLWVPWGCSCWVRDPVTALRADGYAESPSSHVAHQEHTQRPNFSSRVLVKDTAHLVNRRAAPV